MFDFLKRIFNAFVFGNFFIAFCAVGMVFTTFIMNGLPLCITPFTVFLFFATYLLYNFHRFSMKLDYSGNKEFIISAGNIFNNPLDNIFYAIAIGGLVISIFFINIRIYPYLLPLAFLAISYSIPLLRSKKRKIRLPEIYRVKTPVLALVWALTTTIIPLVEQNISLTTPFVLLQVLSRSLFIFALCIPFEIRDVDTDKEKNIRTLPVVYGIKSTKIIGTILIIIEIITHHLMPAISFPSVLALDISSLVALFLIIVQNKNGPYFYKLFVDGTMLVRFFLLFLAIKYS